MNTWGFSRGKRIDNGEWVEGNLVKSNTGTVWIFTYDYGETVQTIMPPVDPDTIGECTGLKDKNGKLIFEGDVVKDHNCVVYPVVFDLTGYYLKYAPPHSHGFHYDLLPLSNYWHAHGAVIEVIGNIHDNPELLKGGEG